MIKLLSFNIRGDFSQDGRNRWPYRAPLVVDLIRRYAPDLIGFQEAHQANIHTLTQALTGYEYVIGPPYDYRERYAYNPIFWRRESWQRIESGGFYLSQTPDHWSVGWDAGLVRCASWVQLRWRWQPVTLIHLNTHFDHVGETARQQSSQLICDRLAALAQDELPVVVTGDFNANAWLPAHVAYVENPQRTIDTAVPQGLTTAPYQTFRRHHFQDCFLAAGHVDSLEKYTFHRYQGAQYRPDESHMALRIDWILTKDGRFSWQTHSCDIIRDAQPPHYPSDHYPVLATLTLSDAASRLD